MQSLQCKMHFLHRKSHLLSRMQSALSTLRFNLRAQLHIWTVLSKQFYLSAVRCSMQTVHIGAGLPFLFSWLSFRDSMPELMSQSILCGLFQRCLPALLKWLLNMPFCEYLPQLSQLNKLIHLLLLLEMPNQHLFLNKHLPQLPSSL